MKEFDSVSLSPEWSPLHSEYDESMRCKIMKTLRIMLDFISGPLRKDVFDTQKKELITGIDVVDSDEYL